MSYRHILPYVCAALSLLLALMPVAQGQETAQGAAPADEAASGPNLDEKSRDVLDKMNAHLNAAEALRFNAAISLRMEMEGMKQEVESAYTVAAKDPNKLAMIAQEGGMGVTTVSDGKQLYTHIPMLSQYTVEDAPSSIRAILEQGVASADPSTMFVATMAADNPREIMLEGVTEGTYVGTETVDGTEAHHMSFKQPDMDWDIWVRTGDEPVVLRIRPDLAKAIGENVPGMKAEMTITYTDWNVGGAVPDETFAFTAPEGAQKVAAFGEGMQQEQQDHALLGETAPQFQLDLLDGGTASLEDHKGKDIVILDFWATWCGPCRRAMPIISSVAKAFEDKNVVLYAVNVREEPAPIQQFLQEQELDVKVALDKDGSVSNQYQAAAIPQTVIIDKDGRVQVVHVGIGPNLESELREQLTALSEGKSLLNEPAPAAEGQ